MGRKRETEGDGDGAEERKRQSQGIPPSLRPPTNLSCTLSRTLLYNGQKTLAWEVALPR